MTGELKNPKEMSRLLLRLYLETRHRREFVTHCQREFNMEAFEASMLWEVIDHVVDLADVTEKYLAESCPNPKGNDE